MLWARSPFAFRRSAWSGREVQNVKRLSSQHVRTGFEQTFLDVAIHSPAHFDHIPCEHLMPTYSLNTGCLNARNNDRHLRRRRRDIRAGYFSRAARDGRDENIPVITATFTPKLFMTISSVDCERLRLTNAMSVPTAKWLTSSRTSRIHFASSRYVREFANVKRSARA